MVFVVKTLLTDLICRVQSKHKEMKAHVKTFADCMQWRVNCSFMVRKALELAKGFWVDAPSPSPPPLGF